MKIVICSKKDLAGCIALNTLLKELAQSHEVSVILSDLVMRDEKNNRFGSYLVAHERDKVLDSLFPYLDSLFPDGASGCFKTYAGLKAHYDLPMEVWGVIRTPQAVAAMRDMAPDIIISCRYDYIYSDEILSIPRLGTYGMHPGKLPAFQGLCSPFRAMECGELRSGCTLFQVDAGIDTGPVIDYGWARIAYDKSLLWNFVQTYLAGINAFMRHFPLLEAGERLPAKPQEADGERYYSYPTEAEFQSFMENGGNLVLPDDYMEMLSWFLPHGRQDPLLQELMELVIFSEQYARLPEREEPPRKSLHP